MTLYFVHEERVPVEDLRPRDVILLPSGRVTVDRVQHCGDSLIVRWWRRGETTEDGDTVDLGSLVTAAEGDTVRVVKGG